MNEGIHRIFTKDEVTEIINIQPKSGMAKAYPKYEIIIFWSEDDQSFIAEVPELAGCMAVGLSDAEALSNAQVVIQEWIDTAQELGREIPTSRGELHYV